MKEESFIDVSDKEIKVNSLNLKTNEQELNRVNKIVRTQNTILIEVKIPHDLPVGDVIKVSSATHMAVSLNSSVGISEIMGATPLLDAFKQYVANLSPILF